MPSCIDGNDHPAPFPIELPLTAIKATHTKTILDPFMGSGTTALAAESMGINWIGCELSEKYCEMIAKRLEKDGTKTNLLL